MGEIILPRDSNSFIPVVGDSFVIVGANGSGKSRLGAYLEQSQGHRSHRIGAQRALQMKEFIERLPREDAEHRLFYGSPAHRPLVNRYNSRWQGDPVGALLKDFDDLLAVLWAQEQERDTTYVRASRGNPTGERLPIVDSHLDVLKKIWRQVFPHRDLQVDDGRVTASSPAAPDRRYSGQGMSDGERVAMYLAGQAVCARSGALLIIDEPELHVHRAIRDPLWDAIQAARPDCDFVFVTHDLEFAESRETATIIWLKGFDIINNQPNWDWHIVSRDFDLPVELALLVLGSRRPVIFVEGDGVTSLDARVYKRIFPCHKIVPVGNAQTVERSVTALRNSPSLHHVKPYGIVDRDRRSIDEVDALKERGVTCCPYAEVESLLIDERVFRGVAARAGATDIDAAVADMTQRVADQLKSQRLVQGSQWGESIVARRLGGFSCKSIAADDAIATLNSHVAQIDVGSIYGACLGHIDAAIAANNHATVLQIFNQKGVVATAASALGISRAVYERMALAAIEQHRALRDHLAAMVPLHE